ncbi:C-type lectin domain family 4 member M-like isoform X2 [Larimichthys crocea]|uniref:C-type lectin domain family 4 member M-like isoform X2 n=1 Tax=Larimichthys crocea TaxID=215358 RepID=UPI000F5F38DC|nr:C-type lectin domain family 4 member M-like isoform X2 [Larimichthys crocea]
MEMSENIYNNDPVKEEQMEETDFNTPGVGDEMVERVVDIYESTDFYRGHEAETKSAVHQQPGRTLLRAVIVCLVLLCVLLLAGVIGTGLYCEKYNFCKDGCTSFNNSFYYISSQYKSWDDSRQDCKDRGADLVIINSKEEQAFITSLQKHVWIGLTDREEQDTWRWVDGSVLNSTGFWSQDQPSKTFEGKPEDCVAISSSTQVGSWNDENCSTPHFWICEKGDFLPGMSTAPQE